jgi:hypothetical protein
LTEYRDGFSECADCHVPLAPGHAPSTEPSEHEVELVTVLETSDAFVMNLAKATLEDAGIEYVLRGDDASERTLSGMSQAGACASQFLVESERAADAREVLEPLRNPAPESGSEEDAEAEPEQKS